MKRLSIVRPLVLAIVLATGTATAWGMIAAWIAGTVEQTRPSRLVNYYITVLEDGTPLIQKAVTERHRVIPGGQIEFFSLDGDPVDRADRPSRALSGAHLWRRSPDSWGRAEWSERISEFRMPGTFRAEGTESTLLADARIWYFIHDGLEDGRGYFVAYELAGNRCTGYLSVDGFSQNMPPRDSWFRVSRSEYRYGMAILARIYATAGEYNDRWKEPLLIRSGDQVMEVDLYKQTVRTVYDGSSLQAIARTTRFRKPTPENKRLTEEAIVVRSTDTIAIVSRKGEVYAEYRLPESMNAEPPDQFFPLPNDRALLVDNHWAAGSECAKLTWIDAEGNVLDQRDVTLGKSEPSRDSAAEVLVISAAVPAPGIMLPILAIGAPWIEQDTSPELTYAQALGPGLARVWPGLLGHLVLGLALRWACVRRQKKYALPWTKTWATFVFVFGIAGYVAYLCHRRWPAREDCTECHKPAPRDRDACALCDAPFPAPEPKGIEIFA